MSAARAEGDHPATRFSAPTSMERGIPLKHMLGSELVSLIGESFARVVPRFKRKAFEQHALADLEPLELTARGKHIARALAAHLPESFADTAPLLIAALGPELTRTEGNGLATFFYLPHANLISDYGLDHFEAAMRANYELTKRFTAEFSVRPYLVRYRDECLALLGTWATDANPHVRRLVSEGTRPRLPWAMRLKEFQQNPAYTLPLLEQLKDDPVLYVRRSVANHLGDLLKDHPDAIYAVCERWLKEVSRKSISSDVAANRKWILRHAVRLSAKQADPRATDIRLRAK